MRKGHGGIYNTGRAKEEKQHLQVKLAALPERERESDGMQCGTGDQIIPLSQQAARQHTQVLASTSLMEVWIVTHS